MTPGRSFAHGALLLAALLAAAVPALAAPAPQTAQRRALPPPTALLTLEWDDLLPDDELAGGFEEPGPRHDYLGEEGPAASQQGSAQVRPGMDRRRVRVPGFIVPLAMDADGLIREAFLVPYFGACIHVPPPPPNQIVHLRSAKGFRVRSIYDPYWMTGTLRTQVKESRLGRAAYALDVDALELYQ